MRKQCEHQCRLCAAVGYCIETCGKCTGFVLWTPIETNAYQDPDGDNIAPNSSKAIPTNLKPATLIAPKAYNVAQGRRIERDEYGFTSSGEFSKGWWLGFFDDGIGISVTQMKIEAIKKRGLGIGHDVAKKAFNSLIEFGLIEAKNENDIQRGAKYTLTVDGEYELSKYLENESKDPEPEAEKEYTGPVHKVPEIPVVKPSIPEIKKTYIPPPDTTKKPEPEFIDESSGIDPETLDVVENHDESFSPPAENDIDKHQTMPPIVVKAHQTSPIVDEDIETDRTKLRTMLAIRKAELARLDSINPPIKKFAFTSRSGYGIVDDPIEISRRKIAGDIAYYETLIEELPE